MSQILKLLGSLLLATQLGGCLALLGGTTGCKLVTHDNADWGVTYGGQIGVYSHSSTTAATATAGVDFPAAEEWIKSKTTLAAEAAAKNPNAKMPAPKLVEDRDPNNDWCCVNNECQPIANGGCDTHGGTQESCTGQCFGWRDGPGGCTLGCGSH